MIECERMVYCPLVTAGRIDRSSAPVSGCYCMADPPWGIVE